MILDIQTIYIKYLDKTNKINKKFDEENTSVLGLDQKLLISNNKKK